MTRMLVVLPNREYTWAKGALIQGVGRRVFPEMDMKTFAFAAALGLALSPMTAIAQSTTSPQSTPVVEPGGAAQAPLPQFAAGAIPFEAVIAGSFVVLGGVVIGTIAATQDSDAAVATTGTN